MSLRKAILNCAIGSWYPAGQKRLRASLNGESADRLLWLNRYPPHSPSHQQSPYGFKVAAFNYAFMHDYDLAFWLDSSAVLKQPLPWNTLEDKGYVLGAEGWSLGQWCNDETLEKAGLSRDQANDITLMEGKVIGLNFQNPLGLQFLVLWNKALEKGWFNGSWDDHRHDISAGAIIAHALGLELTPGLVSFESTGGLIQAMGPDV